MHRIRMTTFIQRYKTFIQRYKTAFIVGAVASAIALIALFLWLTRPMTTQEVGENDVQLVRSDRYFLLSNTDTLLTFAQIEGDTAFVRGAKNVSNAVYSMMNVHGEWVNLLPAIPSCQGRIAVVEADTAALCKARSEHLHTLLGNEAARISGKVALIDEYKEQIAYYLRTHDVSDVGFDAVARLDKRLDNEKDSLQVLDTLISQINASAPLRLVMSSRYFALMREGKKTKSVECSVDKQKDGMVILRTSDHVVPENLNTRLHLFGTEAIHKALEMLKKPSVKLPAGMQPDSLGVYYGSLNKSRKRNGYGHYITLQGDYYEGDWQNDTLTGFGMSLVKGKRMQIGEWKNGKYLGERITYTSDRIYGIDISRHQHEKGRKRYSINWKNLSITSLGHISKKKITGTVNYPVSFVYIKSTEGTTVFNKYFGADYRAARQNGYMVGCYHFFSTRTSGMKQARFFLKRSRYTRGDFPPVLDVEPTAKMISQMGGPNAMFKEIRQWLNAVESAWGVRPILYISQSFVNKYLPYAPDLMKNYNVWIARYGEYRPNVNLIYWQLSPDGRVSGIHGDVDINVFNGFRSEWQEFVK